MAGIRNGVQRGGLVPVVVVNVILSSGDKRQVIVDKVQATSLAVARTEWHVVALGIMVWDSIHHFLAVCPQLQPVFCCGVLGHLVEPRTHCHVLHHNVPGVLDGLGPRSVVQAEGGAGRVLRLPVPYVVQVRDGDGELVVVGAQVLCKRIATSLQRGYSGCVKCAPLRLLEQLLECRLSGEPLHQGRVKHLDLTSDLREAHYLRLHAPQMCELQQVLLVRAVAEVRNQLYNLAEEHPTALHLIAVPLVVDHRMETTPAIRRHSRDYTDQIPQHGALVLVSTRNRRHNYNVLEGLRHLRFVRMSMTVRREDPWAQHEALHGKAAEEHAHKGYDRGHSVELRLNLLYQGILPDEAVLAEGHLALLADACIATPACHCKATVVEGRWGHLLTRSKPGLALDVVPETHVVVDTRVHRACHDVERATTSEAGLGLHVQRVPSLQLHGIQGVLLVHHLRLVVCGRFSVDRKWRSKVAGLVLVDLEPGAIELVRCKDKGARRVEHAHPSRRPGILQPHLHAWQALVANNNGVVLVIILQAPARQRGERR
mmetsp:Transcript_8342/g.22597  ORF Transcript_8342/g.22597 Transcript_8342/m.22597 type:complete len:542 (+) Transcript_8342:1820-3445(+)